MVARIALFSWRFSHEGEHRFTIGRRGEGPGELLNPRSMALVDGTLVVVDHGQRRISFFSEAGELDRTVPFPDLPSAAPASWIGPRYPAVHDRIISITAIGYDRVHLIDRYLAVISDLEGEVLDTLRGVYHRERTRDIAGVVFGSPLHWSTRWSAAPNGRYYATADGGQDSVTVRLYDTADLSERLTTLAIPALPVSSDYRAEVARRYWENMNQTAIGSVDERAFRRALDLPHEIPGVDLLQVTSDGSIWIAEPSLGSPDRVWHVLETDGSVRSVLAPEPLVILDGRGDRFWGRLTDEFGVHYVVRVRIERDPTADAG